MHDNAPGAGFDDDLFQDEYLSEEDQNPMEHEGFGSTRHGRNNMNREKNIKKMESRSRGASHQHDAAYEQMREEDSYIFGNNQSNSRQRQKDFRADS